VIKTVTQSLAFFCAEPNAWPKKVVLAKDRHVYILTEQQLFALLETGELPDECWDESSA